MRNTKLFNLLFALVLSVSAFAQGRFENYILFDASCMEQYDYVRSSNYHDVPFWDFHFQVSPHQTYVFRVLKQEAYQDEISKLDKEPISCQSSRSLDNNFIGDVNNARKTAHIVIFDAEKKLYKLYQVKKIIHFTETAYALSYKDQQRSFVYSYNEINQGKNLDTSAVGRVLFEENGKFGCAQQRRFKSFDKVNPRISENLYFIEKVGLARIETEQGTLDLHSINGELLSAYVQRTCNTKADETASVVIKTKGSDKITSTKVEEEFSNPFDKSGVNSRGIVSTPSKEAVLDANGYYTVQEGDNLYKIALKFNTKVELIKENNGLTSNTIDRNQRLKIVTNSTYKDNNPIFRTDTATGITTKIHIVNQGECLWDIAKRYNTTTKRLEDMNGLANKGIDIQQEIIIERTQSK